MFETSFEDGEAQQIKVSTLSERGAENIGVMELAARVRGGLSSSVQLQSLAGTADHNMNEVKSNLFDGSLRAKYLANVRATQSQPVEASMTSPAAPPRPERFTAKRTGRRGVRAMRATGNPSPRGSSSGPS